MIRLETETLLGRNRHPHHWTYPWRTDRCSADCCQLQCFHPKGGIGCAEPSSWSLIPSLKSYCTCSHHFDKALLPSPRTDSFLSHPVCCSTPLLCFDNSPPSLDPSMLIDSWRSLSGWRAWYCYIHQSKCLTDRNYRYSFEPCMKVPVDQSDRKCFGCRKHVRARDLNVRHAALASSLRSAKVCVIPTFWHSGSHGLPSEVHLSVRWSEHSWSNSLSPNNCYLLTHYRGLSIWPQLSFLCSNADRKFLRSPLTTLQGTGLAQWDGTRSVWLPHWARISFSVPCRWVCSKHCRSYWPHRLDSDSS